MDFSYFGLFSTIRVVGMLSYFDPTHWPDFRTYFQVGNQGTSDLVPSCKLWLISELDVGF